MKEEKEKEEEEEEEEEGEKEKEVEENLAECGFKEKWGHVFSVKFLVKFCRSFVGSLEKEELEDFERVVCEGLEARRSVESGGRKARGEVEARRVTGKIKCFKKIKTIEIFHRYDRCDEGESIPQVERLDLRKNGEEEKREVESGATWVFGGGGGVWQCALSIVSSGGGGGGDDGTTPGRRLSASSRRRSGGGEEKRPIGAQAHPRKSQCSLLSSSCPPTYPCLPLSLCLHSFAKATGSGFCASHRNDNLANDDNNDDDDNDDDDDGDDDDNDDDDDDNDVDDELSHSDKKIYA
uniref:Uncharacterized protein n=1 Tax=Vespula pensylvanica TaxID=30213 RepID=A0A834UCV5_VESPE|nr:hypothetical protein H0235_004779 [Vespula pensylvanica]